MTLLAGGAEVPEGYGIIVNDNVSGDTTFTNNVSGTFRVALGANQAWQNNSAAYAILMNVPVSGTYSLATDGVGTIVLGAANTFSGGLTVSSGTLRATNADSLSTGAATVNSGATLDILAAITKDIANSGTLRIGAGGSLTASSLGGTLSIGGVSGSTATFASTLGSGALALESLTATGDSNLSLAVGTGMSAVGAVDFSGSSNTITLTGAAAAPGIYTLVQGSSLVGTSGLSLTGGGVGNNTLALGASGTVGRSTYFFTSSASALLLDVTGTTYDLVWDNTLASGTWNDTDAAWLQSGTGSPIAFVNTDNVAFDSAASVTVPAAVTAGVVAIGNTSGSVELSGAGSITAASLAKSGAGEATLANATTLSDGLSVSGGSLVTTGPLTVSAGGLSVTNGSLTIGTVPAISGTVSLDSGTLATGIAVSTLANTILIGAGGGSIANDGPLVLSGSLAGTGVVTMTGAGKTSLTKASNAFTGSVVVSQTTADGFTELTTQSLGNASSVTVSANAARPSSANLSINNTTTGTFAGVISGPGIVAITGPSAVTLSGANTYSGGTLLSDDVGITSVWDGTAGSLGSGLITSIGPDARIILTSAEPSITFSQAVNTGTGGGTVLAFSGSGKTFLLTGSAGGSGQLKASTGATLDLTNQTAASNTNTGGIEIGNAYVRAAGDENLGTGTVNFSATGTASGWIAAATGTVSLPITIGASGTNANVRAIFDTSGYDLSLTGGINDKPGTLLGQLIKQGEGALTISGSNGYTGTTTISAGMMFVNGVLAGGGSVTVASGAALGGGGTISGTTAIAGIMAPGNSIGTLTVTNDLVWSGAASAGSVTDWLFELGAGNASDLVNITGVDSDFLRNSSAGSIYRFDFGGSTEQGTFALVSWEGTTDFLATDFSYTNLGDGNTASFVIQGNTLSAVVVPEPTALVLAAFGVGGLLRARLRRR